MASSRISSNLVWVVNDANAGETDATVYAVNPADGSIYVTVSLMESGVAGGAVKVLDVQDIAVDKDGDKSYVYVGVIGLNAAGRQNYFVHKFEEPTMAEM